MKTHRAINIIIILGLCIEASNVSAGKDSTNEESGEKSEDEIEGKIIGGEPTTLKAMPYNVQFFNQGSMCAGTILNSWTLITAAHCFDINKNTDEMVIQIGSRYVYDFNANQYDVVEVLIHKKYNQTGLFACDIALVFLDKPIEFNTNIEKAVLVDDDAWMSPKERNFTVTGWGWTQYGGPISKKGLMVTTLRFIPSKECSKLHKMKMTPDMFCLYGDGTKDTCKGDSGGGVFWHGLLVGITSHGDGCAKKRKPSVYTNVYYFRDWIKTEMLSYIDRNCRFLR